MRFLTPLLVLAALATAVVLPSGSTCAGGTDWLKKLHQSDVGQVYATVQDIAKRHDISGALALLQAGADSDYPHIAIACGDALAGMKPEDIRKWLEDRGFKKAWKKLSRDKDPTTQRQLARVLGAWGHPFVDEALAHLASGRRKPEVQAEALFMCGSLVPTKKDPFPKTQEAIGKALKSRDGTVLAAACSAAGRRKLVALRGDLASIARTSRDDYAGLYAVWALRQIGWEDDIDSFVHVATKSPKPATKAANLKAITELSTIKDVDTLLGLSRHGNQDLRDAAVLALGRIAWRAWHEQLRSEAKRHEAEAVTPRVGGAAPPEKKQGLPEPKLDIPDEVIQRMIQIVKSDSSWEVRDAARQALLRFGKIAQPLVRAKMPEAVRASDEDVALTAIELCGLFGCDAARERLVTIAIEDDRPALRMFAARALEGVGAEKSVALLTKDLRPRGRSRSKDSELHAVRALGYIRNMKAYDFLVGMFAQKGWPEDILRQAEFALERLTAHRFGRKPDRWARWLATASDPLNPHLMAFDRAANRKAALEHKLYGVTVATERAVEGGLRWLQRQQEPIGCWDGNKQGGIIGCQPAYTGLALLAFLGAGYNSAGGKFHETIRRATEFLAATQFYDGGFPVTGGGDSSWIFAYTIGMGVWGITESYGLSDDDLFSGPAQWGIDYLVRVQTPGAGWRYSARAYQSDTSCTSWVLMATKMAALLGLDVAQKSWDGIDSWLTRCTYDVTGLEEIPEDLATDFDYEVGRRNLHQAFTGYFTLSGDEETALRAVSMTAVGMTCRFFMGWKRSHPYMIGAANYLRRYLPEWMSGLERQNARWYFYYWYYGTLAMYQMGGRHWARWNEKIKKVLPEHQLLSPTELIGAWPADQVRFGGGRLLSTPLAIMTLESYYRFSPLLAKHKPAPEKSDAKPGKSAKAPPK